MENCDVPAQPSKKYVFELIEFYKTYVRVKYLPVCLYSVLCRD